MRHSEHLNEAMRQFLEDRRRDPECKGHRVDPVVLKDVKIFER